MRPLRSSVEHALPGRCGAFIRATGGYVRFAGLKVMRDPDVARPGVVRAFAKRQQGGVVCINRHLKVVAVWRREPGRREVGIARYEPGDAYLRPQRLPVIFSGPVTNVPGACSVRSHLRRVHPGQPYVARTLADGDRWESMFCPSRSSGHLAAW